MMTRSTTKSDGMWNFPYEPWAPIVEQVKKIRRAVNWERRSAGYELVSWEYLRLRRASWKVYFERKSL